MESVVNNCISIAETDSSVMIRGESGVGKEGIAKLIHSSSKRKDFPMIPVNCGAIPPELFESEFFGYRPGAFTGANAKGKTGFVQLAHKGTLFLDEVGELPLPMQSKLLRFVETGEYYPIGSAKAEKADVRIIAATSRDLSQMIKDKTFREDLYYRLHVLPIRIPPLRDRPEDIECIALYYLEKFNKKYKKNLVLRPSDIELLQQYSWPGNIRELRNSIERTVVLNNLDKARKVIEALINPYIQDAEPLKNSSNFSVQPDLPLNTALEQFELRYLQAVVDHHGGHLQDAANTLGIHRSTLYRKLHR
jgi:transcriptional regulator with PAS, ATPase and Fis domain